MTHIIRFPFHIGDFLSGTLQMDAAEIGAYTMLIVAHYQAGEYGLPDDDARLARICHCTEKVWKRLRVTLAEKFTISNGRWVHDKVVETLQGIEERSENATENADKRWENERQKRLDFNSQKAPDLNDKSLKNIEQGHANAYANHQPLSKDDKTPLPPSAVDNPTGKVWVCGKVFDIADHLGDAEWRVMLETHSAWDRFALCRRYNAWIATLGNLPRKPRRAFLGWLKTQPEKP